MIGVDDDVAVFRESLNVTILTAALTAMNGSARHVEFGVMAPQRINITLDREHATKPARLAARVHVSEGTLARSLLSSAIDDADPDVGTVVAVLNGIDGAWGRAHPARRQAASGDTNSIDELQQVARVGAELTGRWEGLRFFLGPWRWMLLVYELQEADDRIVVLTVQDARSPSTATHG